MADVTTPAGFFICSRWFKPSVSHELETPLGLSLLNRLPVVETTGYRMINRSAVGRISDSSIIAKIG